jgi:hypothetical protein
MISRIKSPGRHPPMSQVLIHQYLAQLDLLKKVSGTNRESVVREAFKDLLKGWGKQHDLVFIPEYRLESPTRETHFVDGALLHELRAPFAYWEVKDEADDLDQEIARKFRRGYPQDKHPLRGQHPSRADSEPRRSDALRRD